MDMIQFRLERQALEDHEFLLLVIVDSVEVLFDQFDCACGISRGNGLVELAVLAIVKIDTCVAELLTMLFRHASIVRPGTIRYTPPTSSSIQVRTGT